MEELAQQQGLRATFMAKPFGISIFSDRFGPLGGGNFKIGSMGLGGIWGWNLKMVGFPNKPMGFPTKTDHFGGEIGDTTI